MGAGTRWVGGHIGSAKRCAGGRNRASAAMPESDDVPESDDLEVWPCLGYAISGRRFCGSTPRADLLLVRDML